MSITTVDQALAGMRPPFFMSKTFSTMVVAGRMYSTHYLAGTLGAAPLPTGTLEGTALTALAGQIPVPPTSDNTHLARFSGGSSAQGGLLMLCDRLWHNVGISPTATTLQTINSVEFPPRDSNGTSEGEQVMLGLEVVRATGSGVPSFTVEYTNSKGVANRTATLTQPTTANSVVGTMYLFALQEGDTGVRSVQSIQSSASWTTGTIQLVAFRVISTLELMGSGVPNAVDVLTSGMPRLFDDSVPFVAVIPTSASPTNLVTTLIFTQG